MYSKKILRTKDIAFLGKNTRKSIYMYLIDKCLKLWKTWLRFSYLVYYFLVKTISDITGNRRGK
jgi:hypothetical protein